MRRVLKNNTKHNLKTTFRGREYTFRAKGSGVYNMNNEEQAGLYHHWKQTYAFLQDITARLEVDKI